MYVSPAFGRVFYMPFADATKPGDTAVDPTLESARFHLAVAQAAHSLGEGTDQFDFRVLSANDKGIKPGYYSATGNEYTFVTQVLKSSFDLEPQETQHLLGDGSLEQLSKGRMGSVVNLLLNFVAYKTRDLAEGVVNLSRSEVNKLLPLLELEDQPTMPGSGLTTRRESA